MYFLWIYITENTLEPLLSGPPRNGHPIPLPGKVYLNILLNIQEKNNILSENLEFWKCQYFRILNCTRLLKPIFETSFKLNDKIGNYSIFQILGMFFAKYTESRTNSDYRAPFSPALPG